MSVSPASSLCLRALPLIAAIAFSVPRAAAPVPAPDSAAAHRRADSAMAALLAEEKALKYQTGEIKLGDRLATARLPDGYRYLDPEQSDKVLSRMWGNPPDNTTLGMIFAPGVTPLSPESWAVIISYAGDGYVKDGDAGTIDYDKLLKDMRKSAAEENKEREKAGYESIQIVGWAERPRYDGVTHKLHWAKELKFGGMGENTLNYNIRILGRNGVLVLNAVSGMSQLARVKEGVEPILKAVEFQDGKRYADYQPGMDRVATYGIAGLVAGTVLAKVGFFKLLIAAVIAAKKFIVIGVLAVVAFVRRAFGGGKAQERRKIEEVTRKLPEGEARSG